MDKKPIKAISERRKAIDEGEGYLLTRLQDGESTIYSCNGFKEGILQKMKEYMVDRLDDFNELVENLEKGITVTVGSEYTIEKISDSQTLLLEGMLKPYMRNAGFKIL